MYNEQSSRSRGRGHEQHVPRDRYQNQSTRGRGRGHNASPKFIVQRQLTTPNESLGNSTRPKNFTGWRKEEKPKEAD
jgi:hypothetical protein